MVAYSYFLYTRGETPGAEGPAGIRGPDGNVGRSGPRGTPGPPGITVLDGNARSRIKTELYQQITKEMNSDLAQRLERERRLGLSYNYPADGCEIVRNNPQTSNGWYWVRDSSDNSTRKVYCYPSVHTSCGEGVWMRIGYFDMGALLPSAQNHLSALQSMGVGTAEGLEQDVHLSTSVHWGRTTLQSVEWWRATSTGARIALNTQLHPKHQMTCMQKEYPLLMDPPHDTISGRMQWDKMPTLTQGTHLLISARVLQKVHPGLCQPFLQVTTTGTLELPSGTAIKMPTSTLIVCGTTLVPPVCQAPLAVTIPTSLGSRRS